MPRTKPLTSLLKKGDRVAVSNITGREASKVSVTSQRFCGNIVGGWALGKGSQSIEVAGREPIPVFPTCEALYKKLPKKQHPNKVVIYSPPEAVYGDAKAAVEHGKGTLETIFIITEHVSVEVTAKIHAMCADAGVDVVGCNTLGVINAHDGVRVGAVGGDTPEEGFRPGSVTVISNSGNMVNTIASYLQTTGLGVDFGLSTGKDVLILKPLLDLVKMAQKSPKTKLLVLYVEPGGLYEEAALAWLQSQKNPKPLVVYVAGKIMEGRSVSLGHAGSVVEGPHTTASGKMAIFDAYFGTEPFQKGSKVFRGKEAKKTLARGVRVNTLHDIPAAAMAVYEAMGWKRDMPAKGSLKLNPWFQNFGALASELPQRLLLNEGTIPEPYGSQFARYIRDSIGLVPARRNMKAASHASGLLEDGQTVYGYPLTEMMERCTLGESLILAWTGELPRHSFEAKLVEMGLIACLTNGPGTISAQGAKLSASAGNSPHTAMIGTLASIGDVHGGNGRKGLRYLLKIFRDYEMDDPYGEPPVDLKALAQSIAVEFKARKAEAKNTGIDYERIPCVGHPVFNDKPVNYDPRERVISKAIESAGVRNIFLEFYHHLARALRDAGVSSRVWAVNMDAALASIWLGICWLPLKEKRITLKRAEDCAFLSFAVARAAGGAAEFLDHQDYGMPMDMRVPRDENRSLTRFRAFE